MRIYPKEKLNGIYFVPSDKYALHCALILSAIVKGKTTIIARADHTDVAQTAACIKRLGARIKRKGDAIEVRGVRNLKEGTYRFECGNSGSTMRLMCGVAAGADINAVLVGGKTLSKRSMQGVKEPLEMMGATVALTDYTVPPIWLEGAKVRPIKYELPCPVAQEKAAILFAALCGNVSAEIKESVQTDNSAEILLKEMGADIKADNNAITIGKSELTAGKTLYIAGDAHAANILLSLGILLGKVTVKNVSVNPSKTRFIDVVKRMGGKITVENKRLLCGETIGDVTAERSRLKAIHVNGEEAALLAGDLPVLAVLMGTAEGESIIADYKYEYLSGVSRLGYICEMLNALGGIADAFDGGLRIKGVDKYVGGSVKTYSDHKIALAAAVALAASKVGGEIDDEFCVNTSFPGFFDCLKQSDVGIIGKDRASAVAFDMHGFILGSLGLTRYSVSAYKVPADNPRKFFSEMKFHAGYSAYYPYSFEAMRGIRLSQSANYLRTMDAAKGGIGYSFLGNGIVLSAKYAGETFASKKVLVIGGGNAARSIIHALIEEKARVHVCDRNLKTATDISKRTKGLVTAENAPIGEYFAVINASLSGSGYYEAEMPIPEDSDLKFEMAIDIALSDEKTPFLRYAEHKGAKTIDGSAAAFFTSYLSDVLFFDRSFSENDAFAAFSAYENEI